VDVIYRSNTNVVEVPSLTNGLTDALVSGATVTCTIVTATGAQVVGATGFAWPVSLSAASGATGTYRGVLPHTLTLADSTTYYAEITADAGTDLYAFWRVPVRAVTRT
jgi:hypothetical protein